MQWTGYTSDRWVSSPEDSETTQAFATKGRHTTARLETKTRGDDAGAQGAGSAAGVSAESWGHRGAAATTVKAARGGSGRSTLFSFPRPLQPRVSVPQAWLLCPSRWKGLRTVPAGSAPWDRVHQGKGEEWVWAQTDLREYMPHCLNYMLANYLIFRLSELTCIKEDVYFNIKRSLR